MAILGTAILATTLMGNDPYRKWPFWERQFWERIFWERPLWDDTGITAVLPSEAIIGPPPLPLLRCREYEFVLNILQ